MDAILVILGGLGTASGWFFAWRARGETNAAGDRARIAEVRADAAAAKALEAQAARVTAETQAKAMTIENTNLRMTVAREQAKKADLLEKLAKLGAPVGDVLLDSTIDRLYKNGHRQGDGAGTGGDPTPVPAGPARPPGRTDPRG